ncbi:MAG: hypothetical protein M3Q34_03305 [bacterium]|nr:hypothetical protein [bacterium]
METDNKKLNKPSEDMSEKEETKKLVESLSELKQTIKLINSNKMVIWRGVLTGLSGAIGATMVFGLLITLVSGILYTTSAFPELNEFLNSLTNKYK